MSGTYLIREDTCAVFGCEQEPTLVLVTFRPYSEVAHGCPTCGNPDYSYTRMDLSIDQAFHSPICAEHGAEARAANLKVIRREP